MKGTCGCVDRIGVPGAGASLMPFLGIQDFNYSHSIPRRISCYVNSQFTTMNTPSLKSSRPLNTRHDTTEYEETAPLTSMSEVSRTISRESIGRIQGPVEHPKKVYWSFWLLGAVILLSWNGACGVDWSRAASLSAFVLFNLVLLCTLPLFTALLPRESALRHNLPSYITTFFTLGNFGFLFAAQRSVGKVRCSLSLPPETNR
jgi:hypothetical protein